MPANKEQHYVPKFYLRLFSDDKKSINIYNILNHKLINNGNLKSQCCKNYFYGKDLVIETAFQEIENNAALIIKDILLKNSAPNRLSDDYKKILAYTILQQTRTQYSADEYNEAIDKLGKYLVEKTGKFTSEELESIQIKNSNAVVKSLEIASGIMIFAMDLTCKVIINKTNLNFITSDNPVIFYNKACEHFKMSENTIGLACQGLQIIFPISPKHILIFYDDKIYKTGKRKEYFSDITIENDVRQFNNLQWLNALENIYFNKDYSTFDLRRQEDENTKKRKLNKCYINEESIRNNMEIKMNFSTRSIKIKMNIQCIKQLKVISEKKPYHGLPNMPNPIRDLKLAELHKEFTESVNNEKYLTSDFDLFIKDKNRIELKKYEAYSFDNSTKNLIHKLIDCAKTSKTEISKI